MPWHRPGAGEPDAEEATGQGVGIFPTGREVGLGRSEADGGRFVTTENSMGVVQSSEGKLTPASEHLLSEPDIVARMAEAVLGDVGSIRWRWLAEDYDRLRAWIEAVVPGFENFNARVRQPGGFYLPNAAKERVWNTPNSKANFSSAPLDSFRTSAGRFLLQTLRSHDQFNTTIYGLDDRYRGISGMRDIVFLNPEDLAALGVKPGGRIDVTSHWTDGERHLKGFRAITLNGKLRVESGWLIADPEEFTSEWNLILRVSQEFGTSLLF